MKRLVTVLYILYMTDLHPHSEIDFFGLEVSSTERCETVCVTLHTSTAVCNVSGNNQRKRSTYYQDWPRHQKPNKTEQNSQWLVLGRVPTNKNHSCLWIAYTSYMAHKSSCNYKYLFEGLDTTQSQAHSNHTSAILAVLINTTRATTIALTRLPSTIYCQEVRSTNYGGLHAFSFPSYNSYCSRCAVVVFIDTPVMEVGTSAWWN